MMKCRLFSALLLLFTLMATGCSGQPAAVTADDLADQVYIYEKEGFGSDFYIALNSDGSMRCSEGALSSYFGLGTWKLDGDTVILTLSPAPVDAAIASANMELVANSLGIGMVYVGYFVALVAQSPRLRQWIGLQETDRVVTCLSMGYPAVRYLRSVPRKPLQARWR